jgi:hypothetical protein
MSRPNRGDRPWCHFLRIWPKGYVGLSKSRGNRADLGTGAGWSSRYGDRCRWNSPGVWPPARSSGVERARSFPVSFLHCGSFDNGPPCPRHHPVPSAGTGRQYSEVAKLVYPRRGDKRGKSFEPQCITHIVPSVAPLSMPGTRSLVRRSSSTANGGRLRAQPCTFAGSQSPQGLSALSFPNGCLIAPFVRI